MDWSKSLATQPYRTTTAAQRIGRLVSTAERNETIMAGLTYTIIESNPLTGIEHAVAEHLALSDACQLRDLLEQLRPADSSVCYHLTAETRTTADLGILIGNVIAAAGFGPKGEKRDKPDSIGGPVVGPDQRD